MAFFVELKDTHVLHAHIRRDGPDVHRKVVRSLLFFEPGTGLALGQVAFELRLQKLG